MSELNQNHLIFSSVPVMDRPLLDRLDPIARAGFDGLSLLPTDIWALEEQGMKAEELAQRIKDAGLRISEVDCIAAWLPKHLTLQTDDPLLQSLQQSHQADKVIEAAARVGARSVAVVEIFGITPSVDEGAEAFAALCDKAAAYDLKVHLEFAPFGGIPNLRAGHAIIDAAGRSNAGLTIDSWHLFRSHSRLADLAAIPAHQIHTVQINDADGEAWPDVFDETMNARLLPGQGSFDLTGLLQVLNSMGSTAPIEVEIFHAKQKDMSLDDISSNWFSAIRQTIARAQKD